MQTRSTTGKAIRIAMALTALAICFAAVSCVSPDAGESTRYISDQATLDLIGPLDRAGRWLGVAVEEISGIEALDDEQRLAINQHLLDLIRNEELRFDAALLDDFFSDMVAQDYPDEAIGVVKRAHTRVGSVLNLHDAYWVAKVRPPGSPLRLTVINDMRIDAATNRVTVYAQSRMFGRVVAPPQVDPGEFAELPNGDRVGFHPNSVYLNGSGAELNHADGSGAWWVKHSWVLGGQGYQNWELKPLEEYGEGLWVEGTMMDDGLSMKIGATEESAGFYNIRMPVFGRSRIGHRVTRYAPANEDPAAGPIDMTPTAQFVIDWKWETTESPLDGLGRRGPTTKK